MNVGPLTLPGQNSSLPPSFTADESLIERALASAKEVALNCRLFLAALLRGSALFIRVSRPHLHKCLVLTGEMEGASIAQAVWLNHTVCGD